MIRAVVHLFSTNNKYVAPYRTIYDATRYFYIKSYRCLARIFLADDVMRAALNDTGGRDKRELGLLLELLDTECATVAHGGAHLTQRTIDILFQRTGVGDIGVHALLKGEFLSPPRS